MRKCLTTIALFAMMTPVAFAKPGDPPLKRERHKYLVLYFAVRHKDGKRAPGRQILRWGVRHRRHVQPATAKEVANSIRQLRALLHPHLVAGLPRQAPAGVMSVGADGTLQRIAACESGGNPRAISPTGTYRGKYQFDYGTWASVGGHGDPAAASEAEQDMRAGMLYAQRGASPWPICGYH